ncbi:hypothetical protein [Microvirga sp. Mcv34]|uniref:hypothetical protein n=1 Tax=Microvirga sp. Mcv34 TaxID=2926016 RepID=UPI0021C6401A|nr:hypothetical protein [Microvirga sp. Mcv34]
MKNGNKTIDWQGVEKDYCAGVMGVREIARWYGISDTAVHKKAKAEGWVRPKQKKTLVGAAPAQAEVPAPASSEPVSPADLADRGRGLAARLMNELDAVTANVGELEEMIHSEESDPRRRQALLKALSLGERANTLRTLSMSLKTLNETAMPEGKKAQRQSAAEKVGGKFSVPSAPKLVVNNR